MMVPKFQIYGPLIKLKNLKGPVKIKKICSVYLVLSGTLYYI
jgi:hypothetical protein